jgi:nucleoside-diphosphate-sugar epimerase
MDAQDVLIVGCGDIGSRTAQGLLSKGHTVYGARRNPDNLPEGVHPVSLDVAEKESWQELALKPDYIIYSVAAGGFDEEAYQAAYATGVQNMLAWLKANKHAPKHIFFVSSTSVYGQGDGEEVDEGTPAHPGGFAGRIMLDAEKKLAKSSISSTVVRFSGIYGPGRDMLIRQVRQGRMAPEVPVMYSNRIHSDDCAGVLNHLLDLSLGSQALEEIYLATDQGSVPLYEVMSWMADILQVIPTEVVESPTRRRASKRCLNTKLMATGYEFIYPSFKEGYIEALKVVKQEIAEEKAKDSDKPQTQHMNQD